MNENVNVQNEKKGVKPAIVFLLVIIFSAIFGVGGWFLGTKLANKEDKNQTKEPAPVEDNNDKEQNAAIVDADEANMVKEESKVLAFGDVNKKLSIRYYVTKENVLNHEEKIDVFILKRKIYFEDKILVDVHMLRHYETKEEAINNISAFALDEYKTLKDSVSDATYNMIGVDEVSSIYEGEVVYSGVGSTTAYLVDVNGKVLKQYITQPEGSGLTGVYADDNMIKDKYYEVIDEQTKKDYSIPADKKYFLYPNNKTIDMHDNYFYYFGFKDDDYCSFTEKKIIVSNGNIEETVINTITDYEGMLYAGQTC